MNDGVIKEEVIEEPCNFTFRNGEYVELKQEEPEQKPENLLEKEIETEPIEFFEDIVQKPKEMNFKNLWRKVSMLKCEICQETMPKECSKLIKLKEDKIVLSENFKIEGSLELNSPYVCVSHIQKVIDDNDGKLKSPSTQSEHLLCAFIKRNKKSMRIRPSRRRICQICYKIKDCSQLYFIRSKRFRKVMMVGCILGGTHSVEQAISFINNQNGITCYSHCKESIDLIFEFLGIENIGEFSKCSPLTITGLQDILKEIDSNFTVDQFFHAFELLFLKSQKFPRNS
ncbi:hypothetical protein B9Z55_021160 [Caenorhabditis nigoni]|uniref:Lin-15A/B-like domain-containing protein n=1 Tax=Caenorhabditis nigoni TaxID=1611254 RepID=A0A2G5TQQ0_9PELO|nr:hypothetical protein B9Z55_021160 [Caenorhabditis nigoni]